MIGQELQRYVADFDRVKRNARALTVGLSREQFNWRPGENRWSMAECLEHCNAVAEQTLPKVEQALRHAREFGPFGEEPFRYGIMGRLFIYSVRPAGPRMPTMPSYEPTPSSDYDPAETMQRFTELQDTWITAVRASDGLDLQRIRVPSPALPVVRLNLCTWYAATPLHELRHLEQAQRVTEAPGFPGGGGS